MNNTNSLQTLDKFKKGQFNTLVATSIGEEGLDIGEVDLIICYDSNASPIRMLQRMGRTGRKRNGNIILLLTKGKEEEQSLKAKDNYNYMQRLITSGERFVYPTNLAPRILPKHIMPEVDKRQIVIPAKSSQEYSTKRPNGKARITKMPPKKFHMPEGAITGFLTGSGKKITSKSLKENSKRNPLSPESDFEPREKFDPDAQIATLDPDPLSCCLNEEEERELRYIYSDVPDASQVIISYPDITRYHYLQGTKRPYKIVCHSHLTSNIQKLKERISEMCVDPDHIARLHEHAPYAEEELEKGWADMEYVSETEPLDPLEALLARAGLSTNKPAGSRRGLWEKKDTNVSRKSSTNRNKRSSMDAYFDDRDGEDDGEDNFEILLPPKKKSKPAKSKTTKATTTSRAKKSKAKSPTPDFLDLTSSQDAVIGNALATTSTKPSSFFTTSKSPEPTYSPINITASKPIKARRPKSKTPSATTKGDFISAKSIHLSDYNDDDEDGFDVPDSSLGRFIVEDSEDDGELVESEKEDAAGRSMQLLKMLEDDDADKKKGSKRGKSDGKKKGGGAGSSLGIGKKGSGNGVKKKKLVKGSVKGQK